MLNQPWIDPASIDFSDSFNPLARPRWNENRNPFMYATLNDPIWQALRNAQNLDPRIMVAPDPMDQLIAAGATFDQQISVEPYSWLYALNASGNQAEGFYVQVTDSVTGSQIFSQPIQSQLLTTASGQRLIYLAAPRYFVPPAYPIVRIVNRSGAAQICTVNLFFAVEV